MKKQISIRSIIWIATIFIILVYVAVKLLNVKNIMENGSYRMETHFDSRAKSIDSLQNELFVKETQYETYKYEVYSKLNGYHTASSAEGRGLGMVYSRFMNNDSSDLPFAAKLSGATVNRRHFLCLAYLGVRTEKKRLEDYPEYLYFVKDDTGRIARLSVVTTAKDGRKTVSYTYDNFRKVKYLYAHEQFVSGILLPADNGFKNFVFIFLTYCGMLAGLFIIVSIIGYSISIVVNISLNKPFTDLNLFRLKLASVGCFAIVLYPYLITSILYLVYFKDLYPEVSFTHSFWDGDYKWCIAGIVYMLLYLAFRKGYKLQQEQDLTI